MKLAKQQFLTDQILGGLTLLWGVQWVVLCFGEEVAMDSGGMHNEVVFPLVCVYLCIVWVGVVCQ